jgi:hypothetical protein
MLRRLTGLRWTRRYRSLLACSTLAGGLGCGPALEQGDAELIAAGEPSITLGYYRDGVYQPLSATGQGRVLWGAQGGTWTMPSVRTWGIASPALVSGTLVLAAETGEGELLGKSEHEYQFEAGAEGSLECRLVAVPVQHAPPRQFESIDDVYGQIALLSISASDAQGRSATSSSTVTLVED